MKRLMKILSFIIVFCCVMNTTVIASSTDKSVFLNYSNADVLDSGKCGEKLTWTLYSDGLLHITGTGRAYDYCKGILIGKTREDIESQMSAGKIPEDYGFQEGKIYDDEHGQYVSPWYKYRDEVSFTEDGGSYCTKSGYDKDNPNGWKYNRIQIDPGITYIGDWMFYRVSGPTELIVPEGVTGIGRWGIRYSPTLEKVVLPDSLVEIEYRGLSRNEVLTEIVFGNSLTTIGNYGLAQNHTIKEIKLPDSVKTVGFNLFEGCDSLETARMGDVKAIPSRNFVGITTLNDVVIPEQVTSIGTYAFYNCSSFEHIKIPATVTSISASAFYMCEELHDVFIDSQAIADLIEDKNSCGYLIANAQRVYLKNGVTSTFFEKGWKYIDTIDGYKKYESYDVVSDDTVASGYVGASAFYTITKTDVENEYCLTVDGVGVLTNTQYTALPWYKYKDNIVSVSIGDSVNGFPVNTFMGYTKIRNAVVSCETIPNQMFYKCSVLENIDLAGVKTIGERAFANTVLKEIVIPDGVTSVGQYAFSGVSTASSVTIGKDVVTIGRNVCPNHKGSLIIPEDNSLQTIGQQAFTLSKGEGVLTLPDIVTIGDKAFMNNKTFTAINIGSSIESIGAQAFEYSENATVTIGTAQENVTIGLNAFRKTPSGKLLFSILFVGKGNTSVDYENGIIFTTAAQSVEPEEVIVFGDDVLVLTVASYEEGGTELLGTGSDFYIFVGDEYKGKYKMVVNGDLNGDSLCDVLDVAYAEKVSTGNVIATETQIYAANGFVSDTLDASAYQNVVNYALTT